MDLIFWRQRDFGFIAAASWLCLCLYAALPLAQAHSGNRCLDFYTSPDGKQSSPIDALKKTIVGISGHESIKNRSLRANSKGNQVLFLHPLVEHFFKKATPLVLDSRSFKPKNIHFYEEYRDRCISLLKAGEFSYAQMLAVPDILARVFSNSLYHQSQNIEYIKRIEYYKEMEIEEFVKMGVYPLPMFFTPDFELRVRLWANYTPPISLNRLPFASELDRAVFSIGGNVEHDFDHARQLLKTIKNVEHAKVMSDIQNAMIDFVDGLSFADKQIAYFFLHKFFPEAGLTGLSAGSLAELKETLKFRFENNDNDSFVTANLSDNSWAFRGMHLYEVKFEIAPNQLILFGGQSQGKSAFFIEGSKEQFSNFVNLLKEKLNLRFQKILDDHGKVLGKSLD